ncbi:conserved hypothetical protein [Perkinsus marinus ATCC 50983]|uniref:Cation efflux protein transmembrane domain-containing protein n=1 Tax=Perkinsus marinus (strain ATCC 50983 / TXsc) TaxID=423536 RepID=C5LMP7_PERM5|nr:conserved hypothetical protein [Perkinsus marinus ATCC 50983]EER01938.1 conserved hypothetical protein [Perkinsus marinus ATCC 50983]|eukprot:XP_002769220.1 conserved hypothetical protein [Perkinsus marinus ATCC 50983]
MVESIYEADVVVAQTNVQGMEREWVRKAMSAFQRQLKEPDHVWIRRPEARKQFGLSDCDLDDLASFHKQNPYESDEQSWTLYRLPDVIQCARKKYKSEETMAIRYKHYLESEAHKSRHRLNIYGMDDVWDDSAEEAEATPSLAIWRKWSASDKAISGAASVWQGLLSNVGIASIKFIVWISTGSSAVFADLMHSGADVANYGYRYSSLLASFGKGRDIHHPYGYGRQRNIAADRSFFILTAVGGMIPMYTATKDLFSHYYSSMMVSSLPATTATSTALGGSMLGLGSGIALPVGMFLVSASLEALALNEAYRELRQQNVALSEAIRSGADVMPVATFLEAGSGILGAAIGIVGVVRAPIACLCPSLEARSGTQLLLGATLPSDEVEMVIRSLEADPVVVGVYDVKTELVGTTTARFKAEVEFNAEAVTRRRLKITQANEAVTSPGPTYRALWPYGRASLHFKVLSYFKQRKKKSAPSAPPCIHSLKDEYTLPAVLRTNKGLVRGVWLSFEALDWFTPLPRGSGELRDLLITAFDLEKIATFRAGMDINPQVERIGQGSYCQVVADDSVALRRMSSRETERLQLRFPEMMMRAADLGVTGRVYGYGWCRQHMGGRDHSMCLVQERLVPVESLSEIDEDQLFEVVTKLSILTFHNDLKLDNIMKDPRDGSLKLIDFDLVSPDCLVIPVTASQNIIINCKEDFPNFSENAVEFRAYYDYFTFSLTLSGASQLYTLVLNRLIALGRSLKPFLEGVVAVLSTGQLAAPPFEALVREKSINAVTVNIFDLYGNAVAHGMNEPPEGAFQLIESNGVYAFREE